MLIELICHDQDPVTICTNTKLALTITASQAVMVSIRRPARGAVGVVLIAVAGLGAHRRYAVRAARRAIRSADGAPHFLAPTIKA